MKFIKNAKILISVYNIIIEHWLGGNMIKYNETDKFISAKMQFRYFFNDMHFRFSVYGRFLLDFEVQFLSLKKFQREIKLVLEKSIFAESCRI